MKLYVFPCMKTLIKWVSHWTRVNLWIFMNVILPWWRLWLSWHRGRSGRLHLPHWGLGPVSLSRGLAPGIWNIIENLPIFNQVTTWGMSLVKEPWTRIWTSWWWHPSALLGWLQCCQTVRDLGTCFLCWNRRDYVTKVGSNLSTKFKPNWVPK